MQEREPGTTARDSAHFLRLLRFLANRPADANSDDLVELEQLGERYELLRSRLIRLFQWKGCPDNEADVLADETFDRVMKILDGEGSRLAEEFQGDPLHYVCRVGRNIYLEWTRRAPQPKVLPPAGSAEEKAENERAQQCLDLCIDRLLTGPERELILDYYQGEKRRKIDHRAEIASRHQLSVNGLRIQVCRIRSRLRECVTNCVSQKRISANPHLEVETNRSERIR